MFRLVVAEGVELSLYLIDAAKACCLFVFGFCFGLGVLGSFLSQDTLYVIA
jgi:hypothetical protein